MSASLIEYVHTQLNRPAGAGMVVPVMVPHAEHLFSAYRPAVGTVNCPGNDALESGVRRSCTP